MSDADPRYAHCPACAGGRVDCRVCDGEGIVKVEAPVPDDAAIDADLRATLPGYDPRDKYPEWGNGSVRDAYRAGYEAGWGARG